MSSFPPGKLNILESFNWDKTMQNESHFFLTHIFLLANKSREKSIYSLSKPVAPDPGGADSLSLPLLLFALPHPSTLAFSPARFLRIFPAAVVC